MKILMLKMVPPFPLESGTDWVSYHLMRTLALEHDITYVTLTRSPRDDEAIRELEKHCSRVVSVRQPNTRSIFHRGFYKMVYGALAILTATPMVVWYNTPRGLRRRVRNLLLEESFDMIHVEYWYSAAYAGYALSGCRVLLKHDVAYLADLRLEAHRGRGLGSLRARLRLALLRRAELKACRRFDRVFTLTDVDRDALAGALEGDVRLRSLPALVLPFAARPHRDDGSGRIVFLGHLGRPLAIDAVTYFCDEILPRVQRELPETTFEIIGSGEEHVRHLGERRGVRLVGFVSDVVSRIDGAALMVVPLRGGTGIKVKMVEGMFAGLPIVATSIAAEGIGVAHGREVMIADDPEAFARCVIELLKQPGRRKEMAERARLFAQERYGSESARRTLLDFYADEVAAVA